MLIFPEIKLINRINNLDNLKNDILRNKSFEFILSILLIDNTEDCDYFIYKYNLSNKEKDKINLLNSIFSEEPNSEYFTKDNLLKILLQKGKENLIDILDFKILISKKNKDQLLDIKNFFNNCEVPEMPVKAKDLIVKFQLKEGNY